MPSLDAPPQYSSIVTPGSGAAEGQVFEENEYGEMKPSETSGAPKDVNGNSIQPAHLPSGIIFSENQYGEISDQATPVAEDGSREATTKMRSSDFGQETDKRSEAFQSDQIYPENRFGELGRADTMYEEPPKPSTSDKVKGTAEQLIGKVIGNKELHDKGVMRKSPVMAEST